MTPQSTALHDSFCEYVRSPENTISKQAFFQSWRLHALPISLSFYRDFPQAEDQTHQLALKILELANSQEGLLKLSAIQSIEAWTFVCVKRQFLSKAKQESNRREILEGLLPSMNTRTHIQTGIDRGFIIQQIEKMPNERHRSMLLMMGEGFTDDDLSQILAIPKANVRKVKYRARKALELLLTPLLPDT